MNLTDTSWSWPHYFVFFWQFLSAGLTLTTWWLADDQYGRPLYSWTNLIGRTIGYAAVLCVFNWVLAQGGFWP